MKVGKLQKFRSKVVLRAYEFHEMYKAWEEICDKEDEEKDLSANLILTYYSDDIHGEIPCNKWWKTYIKYHKNNNTHHLNVYKKGKINKKGKSFLERLIPKKKWSDYVV